MNKTKADKLNKPKLNVKEVLQKSVNIYKIGFKSFIILSALAFAVNFILRAVDYGSALTRENAAISMVFSLMGLVLTFVNIYVAFGVTIAIYTLADKIYSGSIISVKEAFAKADEVLWTYIGAGLRFVLMLAVPVISIFIVNRAIQRLDLKIASILLLLLPTAYLYVKYGFATTGAVLSKEKHDYFHVSKLLVKNDFWSILLLTIITNFIFMAPYQIYIHLPLNYRHMTEIHTFIASQVNQLFFMLTSPFSYISTVVMYLTLKRNKRIKIGG